MDAGDFPRGGVEAVEAPTARRAFKLEDNDNDVLFGKKTTKTQTRAIKGEAKPRAKASSTEQLKQESNISVEPLAAKKLSEGFHLLGCVREIHNYEMLIGLPNGLMGYVPITGINDIVNGLLAAAVEDNTDLGLSQFSSSFHVGSYIPVTISTIHADKHGYKKVELTVNPKRVNDGLVLGDLLKSMMIWGNVSSVEDHGCIVSFGSKRFTGFCRGKETDEMKDGVCGWFSIQKVSPNQKVLDVKLCKDMSVEGSLVRNTDVSFPLLRPGQLVKATISKVTDKGLVLSISDYFSAIVDLLHLPENGCSVENFKVGKKVTCRLIYIKPSEKLIGASLLGAVVRFQETIDLSVDVGAVCECVVKRVDTGMGILTELETTSALCYCHISRMSDSTLTKIPKAYKAGTTHQCRVLGYNAIDMLHQISLQKSVIEQPFLRYHDLHPGIVIEGQVATLGDYGMIVRVSEHIKGLCPRLHLSDIILKHPERKFTDGKKIKCRVLEVKPDDRRLVLTHKKTMVNSTYPIVVSPKDIAVGLQSHGYIMTVTQHGIVVGFYNRIRGFAHISTLGLQEGETPAEVFYIGQVVLCMVKSYDKVKNNLKLTLMLSNTAALSSAKQESSSNISPGTVLNGNITHAAVDHLDVTCANDSVSSSLPVVSLSDFSCLRANLLDYFSKAALPQHGDGFVVTGTKKSTQCLSWKHSQAVAAKLDRFVSDFSQLKVDLIAVGSVTHIMDYGLFVELASGLVGLAPISHLTEQFISDPHQYFKVGQSVLAKVIEIDDDKHRFLLTLVHTVLMKANQDVLVQSFSSSKLVEMFLEERKRAVGIQESCGDGPLSLGLAMIGTKVKCKVESVTDTEIVVTSKKLTGIIPIQSGSTGEMSIGEKIYCRVIDFNMETQQFIASNSPLSVDGSKSKARDELQVGSQITVETRHITSDYIVASVPSSGHQLVWLASKQNLNDVRDVRRRYVVGQTATVTVASVSPLGVVVVEVAINAKEDSRVGSIMAVEIKSVKALQLNISLCNSPKIHGRVHIAEMVDDIVEGKSPLAECRPGQVLQAKLVGFRDIRSHKALPITHRHLSRALLDFSIKPSILKDLSYKATDTPSTYDVGRMVTCFVKSVSRLFVWVVVDANVAGRIHLCHLSQNREVLANFKKHFKLGSAHRAQVIGNDDDHNCLELSCVGNPSVLTAVGKAVCGRVSKIVANTGLLVELPSHTCGFVHLTQLSDEYTEEPLKDYTLDQIVHCCVISRQEDGRLELSLRPSRLSVEKVNVSGTDKELRSFDDVKEGSVLRGYVKSCSDVGVFVSLASKIVGRAQIKDLSQYFVKNWKPLFPVGKLVTAMVKTLDASTNHIGLSFRGKDTGKPDMAPAPKRSATPSKTDDEPSIKKRKRKLNDESADTQVDDKVSDDASDVVMANEDDEDSNESESDEEKTEDVDLSEVPRLKLPSTFDWNAGDKETLTEHPADVATSDSADSDDEKSAKTTAKKTKRQKRAAKKDEEDQLHKAEMALLDEAQGPQSAADFDRILLGSPNSSLLWIQYMAFHLHAAETEKARAVVQRALKTISFREEQEKLNVWVAWLNLECTYGTEDTLKPVFRDAVQHNDAKTVHMRMANIYVRTKKTELAEQSYATMAKKFGASRKVWLAYAYFLMSIGRQTTARNLLDRALKTVPKRKHVELIVKFAMLEFKFGERQRGVTMFESVIKNYPRRTDLWSIYIDATVKAGDLEQVRNIFERATSSSLPLRKVKFFFKRYLDFERKFGDESTVAHVKEKAMNYAESSRGSQ